MFLLNETASLVLRPRGYRGRRAPESFLFIETEDQRPCWLRGGGSRVFDLGGVQDLEAAAVALPDPEFLTSVQLGERRVREILQFLP